jgi:hypothetical protein
VHTSTRSNRTAQRISKPAVCCCSGTELHGLKWRRKLISLSQRRPSFIGIAGVLPSLTAYLERALCLSPDGRFSWKPGEEIMGLEASESVARPPSSQCRGQVTKLRNASTMGSHRNRPLNLAALRGRNRACPDDFRNGPFVEHQIGLTYNERIRRPLRAGPAGRIECSPHRIN